MKSIVGITDAQKQAVVIQSEASKQQQILIAEGSKGAVIAKAEGDAEAIKLTFNAKAQGEAAAILSVAEANASALRQIGEATQATGGQTAMNLKVAEQYVQAFQNMASKNNTLIVPANMGDISTLIASAMKIVETQKQ
jgi:regulator of protease activity HflC (stomatin/prohibitin superfamily)